MKHQILINLSSEDINGLCFAAGVFVSAAILITANWLRNR